MYSSSTSIDEYGAAVARFNVVWDESADRAMLRNPWKITADGLPLAAAWTPSSDEAAEARSLIDLASTRVVTTTVPASLQASLVATGGSLAVGEASTLRLTITNTGGSSAVDVVLKTRSATEALHGLTAKLARVHPGSSVTRDFEVLVPIADGSGESARVLVGFKERNGRAPAELVVTIPFSRSLCPSGVLTRAQYAKRRKKLQGNVDAGNLSREEFDRLDAEMLRCLQ
jgi:hypothetical protein